MDYKSFKNELENYYKHLKNIDRIQEEIDLILYEMEGVKAVRYDKQPSSYNASLNARIMLEMSEKLEEKEIELNYAKASVKYIEMMLKKMPEEDRAICLKVISEGVSAEQIARQKGYSRGGMWKRIKREVTKILK